jgi:hypothetical protein
MLLFAANGSLARPSVVRVFTENNKDRVDSGPLGILFPYFYFTMLRKFECICGVEFFDVMSNKSAGAVRWKMKITMSKY